MEKEVMKMNDDITTTEECTEDFGDLHFGEGQYTISTIKPAFNMVFNDDCGEVGRFDWNGGTLKFSGKMTKSAEVFLKYFKPFLDEYVKFKLEEEKMKSKILTNADIIRLNDLTQRRDKIENEIAEIYGGVQYEHA